MPVPRFIRGIEPGGQLELAGDAGGGQEVAAEVGDRHRVLDGGRAVGQRLVELRQLGVDGDELGGIGVAVGVGDGPDDAVVVGHHGDRPAQHGRVAGDGEDDVLLALVLQRRLDLGERARDRQRVERRHLVAAQVEALVGAGERQVRPEGRGGDDRADDDRGTEHQPGAVGGRRRRRRTRR